MSFCCGCIGLTMHCLNLFSQTQGCHWRLYGLPVILFNFLPCLSFPQMLDRCSESITPYTHIRLAFSSLPLISLSLRYSYTRLECIHQATRLPRSPRPKEDHLLYTACNPGSRLPLFIPHSVVPPQTPPPHSKRATTKKAKKKDTLPAAPCIRGVAHLTQSNTVPSTPSDFPPRRLHRVVPVPLADVAPIPIKH